MERILSSNPSVAVPVQTAIRDAIGQLRDELTTKYNEATQAAIGQLRTELITIHDKEFKAIYAAIKALVDKLNDEVTRMYKAVDNIRADVEKHNEGLANPYAYGALFMTLLVGGRSVSTDSESWPIHPCR